MTEQLQVMTEILNKIKSYDKIIVTRHVRPDGDAIGSSRGLAAMLKLSFPNKKIYVQTEDSSDYLAFLGPDDAPLDDSEYADALLIVTDTATPDRISNKRYELAKEIIKIDHHINIKPYGAVAWVEDWRSSTCEMIAYFYETFKNELKLDKEAATYIFTGLVTDSGRFRYEATTGDTLRIGGMLIDFGIDTETLYAHLYLEEYSQLKFQAYVLEHMQITEHGVVYLHVDSKMQKKFHLTSEQASEAVSYLKYIKGCIAWLAFIDMPDGTIRVRLRSRFMFINTLAEKYNGGGHQCTCGATLYKKADIAKLLADADAMVAEYKNTHEGWL
ncbi:MAG: bifunctional oligoribonuclease/PAP phosphatase NrnA [Clostridiales bacterium]|nr:bifunctional oligoribonuclease/PAP phosphatase NrnA [Clostridiales bacterium]